MYGTLQFQKEITREKKIKIWYRNQDFFLHGLFLDGDWLYTAHNQDNIVLCMNIIRCGGLGVFKMCFRVEEVNLDRFDEVGYVLQLEPD